MISRSVVGHLPVVEANQVSRISHRCECLSVMVRVRIVFSQSLIVRISVARLSHGTGRVVLMTWVVGVV